MTAPILCGAPLGGESERAIFAFFTLISRKHTVRLDAPEVQKALLLFLIIWPIGLALLWWTNLPLKKVEIEGDVLYVSNYLETIEVRLSNIVLAKEIIGRGNLPRYMVKLELNIDTEFGKNIFFVPNLEFDLPKFLERLEASKRLNKVGFSQ